MTLSGGLFLTIKIHLKSLLMSILIEFMPSVKSRVCFKT